MNILLARKFQRRLATAVICALTAPVWTCAASKAGSLTDSEIVALYIQANIFDIETGRLGAQKGRSEQVRTHGSMVAADHSHVRALAEAWAQKMGIKPVLPKAGEDAGAAHVKTIAELESKSGTDFDRAYLIQEVAFHRAAVKAVREVLIPNVKNQTFKRHFREILPAFEHHLAMAVEAAKELGVPTE